jgi:hypothetical protein
MLWARLMMATQMAVSSASLVMSRTKVWSIFS